jgi:hypothetical protein
MRWSPSQLLEKSIPRASNRCALLAGLADKAWISKLRRGVGSSRCGAERFDGTVLPIIEILRGSGVISRGGIATALNNRRACNFSRRTPSPALDTPRQWPSSPYAEICPEWFERTKPNLPHCSMMTGLCVSNTFLRHRAGISHSHGHSGGQQKAPCQGGRNGPWEVLCCGTHYIADV